MVEQKFLQVKDRNIKLKVHNPQSKNSLIIVPGLGRNGNHYSGLAKKLSERYNVITFNPRSHDPLEKFSYDLEGMVSDLSEIINHSAKNSNSVSLLGFSNGAYTSVFCGNNPNLSKLYLVSLPHSITNNFSTKAMVKLRIHKLPHKWMKKFVENFNNYRDEKNLNAFKVRDLYIQDWQTHVNNILNMPQLKDINENITTKTYFIFGNNDFILGIINNKIPKKYDNLFSKFQSYDLTIVPKAKHSFRIKRTHKKQYGDWSKPTKELCKLVLKK